MAQSSQFSIEDYARQTREQIDEALSAYTQFGPGCPAHLQEAIRYSLLAPAKRLRPMLVLMAAEVCEGSRDAALPAACAIEMIHTYSLIHDDLPAMDDDDMRRGRPTCHKKFGEAAAILAGDALLTLAFEVLARDIQPAETAVACSVLLARAAGAMELVGGQADDLAGQFHAGGLESLEAIHRRKTGALILAALGMGGLVAGADQIQSKALEEYGKRVGLAFQITDDLLDVRGNAEAMGKRAGKDSDHGKQTFPALLGVDESMRRAETLVSEACQALAPFGSRAGNLEVLARYVLERNR